MTLQVVVFLVYNPFGYVANLLSSTVILAIIHPLETLSQQLIYKSTLLIIFPSESKILQ